MLSFWPFFALLAIAIVLGGWMLLDGLRAFLRGDYLTPKSGEYAGQLGPWAGLLQRVGIAPRSALVKGLHVAVGAAWLLSAAGLWLDAPWWRIGMAGAALFSLWYLPFGTLGALIVWALLFFVH
jgi:hypothetical protein